MADALSDLDARIKTGLQWYLKKPAVERTLTEYNQLVDMLAQAAMGYAKSLVQERVAVRRQEQVRRR